MTTALRCCPQALPSPSPLQSRSAAPWFLIIAAGALLTAAGFFGLRRPRRTAAVLQ
jgi:LPXTG-motif cell wall-anchored protein